MLDNGEPRLSSAWHAAALSADISAEPHEIRLLGTSWILSRVATDDTSEVTARTADGQVPAALEDRYGLIWLAPEAPQMKFPQLPELDDPAYQLGIVSRRTTVGAGVLIDNFLDVSHFSYLHRNTFGRATPVTTEGCVVEREGSVIRLTHATDLHDGVDPSTGPTSDSWRVARYSVLAPYVVHLQMDFPTLRSHSAATFVCQPEGHDTTMTYVLVAAPADEPESLRAQLKQSADVLAEDLEVLELMADPRLELSLFGELHTRADRASVEYRRMLTDLVGAHGGAS